MFNKSLFTWAVKGFLHASLLFLLTGCNTQNNISSIPQYGQFTIPAIGTLLPGGSEQFRIIDLPENYGGALFVNRSAATVHVVVSDTVVEVQGGHDFLFVLPPASYDFYIYEPDIAPHIFPAKVEIGKTRYIYLLARLPG